MTLGEKIRDCRVSCGLSQGDFAEQMEVSRQSVSKWENDLAVPELDKLVKMCELFGISLDTLVRGDGIAEPAQKPAAEIPEAEEWAAKTAYAAEPEASAGRSPEISGTRKIIGAILLCTGILLAGLCTVLAGFGGLLTGLVYASPLLVCGVYCLVIRRHLGLWIGWTLFVIADLFTQFFTSGGRGAIWNALRNPEMFSHLAPGAFIISAAVNLFLLILLACTLYSFRHLSLAWRGKPRRNAVLLAVGYLAVYGIQLLVWQLYLGVMSDSRVLLNLYHAFIILTNLAGTGILIVLIVMLAVFLRHRSASRRSASGQ